MIINLYTLEFFRNGFQSVACQNEDKVWFSRDTFNIVRLDFSIVSEEQRERERGEERKAVSLLQRDCKHWDQFKLGSPSVFLWIEKREYFWLSHDFIMVVTRPLVLMAQ